MNLSRVQAEKLAEVIAKMAATEKAHRIHVNMLAEARPFRTGMISVQGVFVGGEGRYVLDTLVLEDGQTVELPRKNYQLT